MNLVILISKFMKKNLDIIYHITKHNILTQTQYYFQDIYFYISIKLLLTYTMNFLSIYILKIVSLPIIFYTNVISTKITVLDFS